MHLKNIQFSSPITVFPYFARLQRTEGVLSVRRVRMLGQGMVLYSSTPGQIPLVGIISDIRSPYRDIPTLYRIERDGAGGGDSWKKLLAACLVQDNTKMTPFGIIADFSISRTDELYSQYLQEVQACANVFQSSPIPLLVQVGVVTPPDVVRQIGQMPGVDGIVLSEYLQWNSLPKDVRSIFFGRTESPYEEKGGGLVVGKYWTPIALEWMTQTRRSGVACPIVVGGFLKKGDVERFFTAGATAVYIGRAVKALRPWQRYGIAREARRRNL